jgi:hypothetical protein
MSQAIGGTIPVLTEFQFRPELAGLRAVEAEVQQAAQRMATMSISIPVRADDQLSAQLDEITRAAQRDPIRIQIVGATAALEAQVNLLREQMESTPIRIPVLLDLSQAMNQAALAGGGGGGGAPMMTSAVAGSLSMLPLTGTGLQGSGVSPALPMPVGTGVAGNMTGGNFTPVPMMLPPGVAPAASPSPGAAPAPGQPSPVAAAMNWRTMMHWMLIARAAYDTGEGVYSAGRAMYDHNDLPALGKDIEAGQSAISRIPIVGEVASGIGGGVQRFQSAVANALGLYSRNPGTWTMPDRLSLHSLGGLFDGFRDRNRSGYAPRGFESDVGYGERMAEEQKVIDKKIAATEREIAARHRVAESMEHEIATNDRATHAAGITGAYDRAHAVAADARTAINSDFADKVAHPEYFDAKGNLTEAAKALRASRLGKVDAEVKRSDDEEWRDLIGERGSLRAAQLGLAGNYEGASDVEFSQKMDRAQQAAYAKGQFFGDEFKNKTRPVLEQTYSRDQRLKRMGLDMQSADVVADLGERSREARTRLAGMGKLEDDGQATLDAKNYAADEPVRKLRERLALETDVNEQIRLRSQILSAEDAASSQKALNAAEHRKDVEEQTTHRQIALGRVNLATKVLNLRASGHGEAASELEIEGSTLGQLAGMRHDPRMSAAVARQGAAQLRAFAHPEDHAQIFNSVGDFASKMQTSLLDGDPDAKRRAEETAKKWDATADKWDAIANKLGELQLPTPLPPP